MHSITPVPPKKPQAGSLRYQKSGYKNSICRRISLSQPYKEIEALRLDIPET